MSIRIVLALATLLVAPLSLLATPASAQVPESPTGTFRIVSHLFPGNLVLSVREDGRSLQLVPAGSGALDRQLWEQEPSASEFGVYFLRNVGASKSENLSLVLRMNGPQDRGDATLVIMDEKDVWQRWKGGPGENFRISTADPNHEQYLNVLRNDPNRIGTHDSDGANARWKFVAHAGESARKPGRLVSRLSPGNLVLAARADGRSLQLVPADTGLDADQLWIHEPSAGMDGTYFLRNVGASRVAGRPVVLRMNGPQDRGDATLVFKTEDDLWQRWRGVPSEAYRIATADPGHEQYLNVLRSNPNRIGTHDGDGANARWRFVPDEPLSEEDRQAPALDLRYTSGLEWIWDDTNSGAIFTGAVYRPKNIPAGYHPLGHMAFGPYRLPTQMEADSRAVLVAKALQPNALMPPLDFVWIGDDFKSGARTDMSWWMPVPPIGYRALGHVFAPRRGDGAKPPLSSIMCVRKDLCVRAKGGKMLFTDRGTGGRHSLAIFEVVPGAEPGLNVGAVIAHNGHIRGEPPKYPGDVYTLAATSGRPAAGTGLSQAEVEKFIGQHGPIVHFHPQEKHFTMSAEAFLRQCTEGPDRYLVPKGAGSEAGDLANSRAYVMVKQVHASFTDLQFWFFYGMNGQTFIEMQAWVSTGSSNIDFRDTAGPLHSGSHVGDWEHVTLRVDNRTKQLAAVGYTSHGDTEWYSPAASSGGGHVRVFSALHMHGSYPFTGDNAELAAWPDAKKFAETSVEIKVFSRNICAADGKRFEVFAPGSYQFVSSDSFFVTAPDWASRYEGWRWGPEERHEDTVRFEIGLGIVYPHHVDMVDSGPGTPMFLFE